MSDAPLAYRYQFGDSVIKRNPGGRSRRGWILAQVQQLNTKGIRMPAYVIRWRNSERPERVLQHMLIADPDMTPPDDPAILQVSVDPKLINP